MKMTREAHINNKQLGAKSARGAVFMLVSQSVVFATNFIGIMILARTLSPELFGIMAMAATVSNFIMMFRDFGLTTPVLQRRELSQAQLSGLYWINVAFGIALTALTVALSPVIAWFYNQPDLVPLVSVLATGFLIGTTGAMQDALLRRNMRYGYVALIRIVAAIVSLCCAVAVAWLGYGIWALVIMRLMQQAMLGLGSWTVSRWRPSWYDRNTEMRSLIGTAGHVTGSQLSTYLSRNADNVLIGWQWGGHALGLYDQAYKLMMFPMQQIGIPINSVLLPLLSRLANDTVAYRTVYRRVTEKLVMLAMPLTCLMLILPDAIVRVALGPKWMEAVPIVAWLGVAMVYQPLAFTTNCLLISQNRSRHLLYNGLISSGISILSFVVGLPYGPVGVAASYAVFGLLIRMPFTFWVIGREGPIKTRDQYRMFLPVIWAGALLSLTYLGLRTVPILHEHPVLLLAAAGVVAFPVTAAALAILPSGRALMRDTLTIAKVGFAPQKVGIA
jgi:PST family polysaccharide transporter